MRQPSKRLIIAAALSLVAGYVISWAIMVFVLATEYRLYGFTYLTAVALFTAILIVIFLDAPLNLQAFDWPKPGPKPVRGYYDSGLLDWLTTVDHKKIGIMYFLGAFFFFLIGGILALIIRSELALPGPSWSLRSDTTNSLVCMGLP